MNSKMIITIIALMSTTAFAADLRDASFKGSTNVGNFISNKAEMSLAQTKKIADITAENLKELISKNLALSAKGTDQTAKVIMNIADVSKPAFKLTSKGIALSFKISAKGADLSTEASKEIMVLLDPSSKASGDAITFILKNLFKGSELTYDASEPLLKISSKELGKMLNISSEGSVDGTDITVKIVEVLNKILNKPLALSSDALGAINDLITKSMDVSSDVSTDVSNKVIGKKNIANGFELSGNGISLTSKGVGAMFYVITKGVTAITNIFELNKEEIQKAVERNDQEMLAGLREAIRAEINKAIDNGETLNSLLSDADLDNYIELRLAASNNIH